jgi:phosphopantothenoylcysteine decarboxylase/phosphopantothenate--cysteine ligase
VKIALGVTGCIAAYKSIEVMRGLQKAGNSVQVVLTRSARKFVTPLTFEALSGTNVITDMFRKDLNLSIQHIELAQKAELLAVVPATANILGKFARGIADDFLSTLYLSCPAPVLLAPAMNVEMWNHAAVRENVEILRARGHRFVNPESGDLACGMQGEGRLADVDRIVGEILDLAGRSCSLAGLRALVTAGPTVEDIDPVRFISNRSSGKMGYALAQAARRRGAEVTLVSGPTHLSPPAGIGVVPVRSAAEMRSAVLDRYDSADLVIMTAAVADYRPADYSPQKLKKDGSPAALNLSPTEDILLELGKRKKRQVLVGFAAETENTLANAREKMKRKNLDLVVANDVSDGVFGADTATVHILRPGADSVSMHQSGKMEIAQRVLEIADSILASRRATIASE